MAYRTLNTKCPDCGTRLEQTIITTGMFGGQKFVADPPPHCPNVSCPGKDASQ